MRCFSSSPSSSSSRTATCRDYNATVFYMPWKNFGFGAGWNQFRTNINVDNASYNGHLTLRYGGLMLFFRASY